MNIRHLQPGENWPENVPVGIPAANLDHDWCWLIEDDHGPQGGLLACPMHRAICLLRIVVAESAPRGTARRLLRGVLREAREHGYPSFITMIETGTRCGERMARLAQRLGGGRTTANFNLVWATTERL